MKKSPVQKQMEKSRKRLLDFLALKKNDKVRQYVLMIIRRSDTEFAKYAKHFDRSYQLDSFGNICDSTVTKYR